MHTPSFIEQYPNAIPNELCDKLIGLADNTLKTYPQPYKNISETGRKDWFMFTHSIIDIASPVNKILSNCFQLYMNKYNGAAYSNRYFSHNQKLQVTPPGGGFHEWHNEHTSSYGMDRIMAWMFYLNDIDSGGETEFLHQRVRLKPTKGTLVLFPAAFTHCHRGNPPLNQTKYILTGWYNIAIDPNNF